MSDTQPTEGQELPAEEASSSPSPASPTRAFSLPDAEGWPELSRASALYVLLAMALVTLVRLLHGEGIAEFLGKNEMPMGRRDLFLMQLGGAGVIALGAVQAWLHLHRHDAPELKRQQYRECERWAWFVSPLMLLPALPLFFRSELWLGKHEVMLPLVLFFGMLVEFFVTRSLEHQPARLQPYFAARTAPEVPGAERPFWKQPWLLGISLAGLAFGVFCSYFTIRWHHRMGTAIFDLGIQENLLIGGLYGKINHSPILFPEDPAKYVANHVPLGLYLFLPIYALCQRAETLLVIQSVCVGLAALPFFLFARRHLEEWKAGLLTLALLCYYPLHSATFFEMKIITAALPFIFTMIWAIDAQRYRIATVFFLLTLFMREDMPIPLATIGMFLLLSGKRPRFGALMALLSTIWFIILRFKIMMDAGSWWFPNMYEDIWARPETGFRSVLKTLLSNPAFVLRHIFVEKKFWYLMHLMVPLVFIPARRWYLWAAFIPGAILTLLVTNYNPPIMFSFQYVMHWIPYLFVAAVLYLSQIREENDGLGRARSSAGVLAIFASTAVLSYNYGAFPAKDKQLVSGYHEVKFGWGPAQIEQYARVRKLVAMVPPHASVAATEHLGAHLANRVRFFTLRRGYHEAEYLAVEQKGLRLDKTRKSVQDALRTGNYGVLSFDEDYALLKRGADPAKNAEFEEDWELNPRRNRPKKKPKPQVEEVEAEQEPTGGGG